MNLNAQVFIRLFAAVGICLFGAFIGGMITGKDMWDFIESYSVIYYCGVGAVGFLVVNPALSSRQD